MEGTSLFKDAHIWLPTYIARIALDEALMITRVISTMVWSVSFRSKLEVMVCEAS